jgi:virginiamycin B lyase
MSASSVAVSLKVFVPNRAGHQSPGTLHQLFIAANSGGIELGVYPHGSRAKLITSFTGNISSSSRSCKPVAGGRSCSFKLGVPPGGPYDFLFATFDKTPVNGHIPNSANQLGAAITSARIAKGKANALKVTVGGVVASTFVYAPQPQLFHAIASNTESLVAGAFDADGNLIASDEYVDASGKHLTIALAADTSAGSTITFSPSRFSSAPLHGVTLTYSSLKATAAQLRNGFTTVVAANAGPSAPAGTLPLRVRLPEYPLIHGTDTGPYDLALLGNTIFIAAGGGGKIDYITNGILGSGSGTPVQLTVSSDGNVWWVDAGETLGIAFPKNFGFAFNDPVYTFPTGTGPNGITSGPDGALWVTEIIANAIGRVPVTDGLVGAVTSYPLPTKIGEPTGITVGPDDALWFTEATGKVGRIPVTATPGSSAQISEFTIPTSGHSYPHEIVTGKDGALWFTDRGTPAYIRRITTTGELTSFLVPNGHLPYDIAVAPDGALWFTEDVGDNVARILPSATPAHPNIVEFPTYDSGARPFGIAVAPDGSVYYTEYMSNAVIQMQ